MSKTNQTQDVQALNTFGVALGVNNAFSRAGTETASASTSTSITATGATSHATNDAQGAMIIANTSATWAGTTLYGVIQSHTSGTAPVYTVDRWYTMTGAASGSTPSTSGPFVIAPGMAPFWFVALSSSVAAVAATDTGAAMGGTEMTASGLTRQIITSVTRTAGTGSTTLTLATTFTYGTTGSVTIGRGMLTNSLVNSKNYGYFIDQINLGTPVTVSTSGDTVTVTYTITVG